MADDRIAELALEILNTVRGHETRVIVSSLMSVTLAVLQEDYLDAASRHAAIVVLETHLGQMRALLEDTRRFGTNKIGTA